jgi:hypothetical protein
MSECVGEGPWNSFSTDDCSCASEAR